MSTPALPRTSGARHAIGWVLGLGYGAFLALVVLWPSPVDRPVADLLDRVIQELHERGVPAFVDYELIEFTANIALFVPVGIFFGLMIPLRVWYLTLVLSPALSVLIELAQRTLLSERYAAVSDVIANSIGGTIGVLLAWLLRAAVASRDEKVIARAEAQRGRLAEK